MTDYKSAIDFSQSQIKKLSAILNDFYMVTGIKICVFDANGVELAFAPYVHCEFCKYIHQSKKGASECDKCTVNSFNECKKTKKTYIYRCHMGLTECVSPIYQLNNLIGFIMVGQFFNEKFPATESLVNDMKAKLKDYRLDENKALVYINNIPVLPVEKINASVSILETCASYIYLNKLLSEQSSFISDINKYIKNNIENNITIEDLSRDLCVSLMDLYHLCNRFFNCTPAKYIKKTRLNTACELISDNNIRISEVAYRVGICDYNYFSKIFKKEYGLTPSEYRKSLSSTPTRQND